MTPLSFIPQICVETPVLCNVQHATAPARGHSTWEDLMLEGAAKQGTSQMSLQTPLLVAAQDLPGRLRSTLPCPSKMKEEMWKLENARTQDYGNRAKQAGMQYAAAVMHKSPGYSMP
jgi:hypothetical protein